MYEDELLQPMMSPKHSKTNKVTETRAMYLLNHNDWKVAITIGQPTDEINSRHKTLAKDKGFIY